MTLPRLSDSLIVNDIWLVGLGITLLLLFLWLALYGGSKGVQWLFNTSRVSLLIKAGERLSRSARSICLMLSALTIVLGLVVSSYGIWQELDFQEWADQATTELSSQTLWALLEKAGIFVALAFATVSVLRITKALFDQLEKRLMQIEVFAERRDAISGFLSEVPETLTLAVVYAFLNLLGPALVLPDWLQWLIVTLGLIALVASAARLSMLLATLALTISDGLTSERVRQTKAEPYYTEVHSLMPLAHRVLEAMVYLTGCIIVVRRFDSQEIFAPYGTMVMQLVATYFVTRVLIAVLGTLVYRTLTRDKSDESDESESRPSLELDMEREEARARRETLARLTQSLLRFVVYTVMVMVMLVVVGVDPLPLLAGAGVVGFAVGLASQKILEDIICGFFMLLEDQMLVGDYIKVEDTEGTVEHLHLRVSRIRDRYGRVHTLRNSNISNVINYSRGWTLAVIEMGVAFEADLAQVFELMEEAGERLHERNPEDVFEPSQVMGVAAIDESCLRVRIETRVRPGRHFEMKNELNRLLIELFATNGVEIPYPKGVEYETPPVHPLAPKTQASA